MMLILWVCLSVNFIQFRNPGAVKSAKSHVTVNSYDVLSRVIVVSLFSQIIATSAGFES